jgi:hypothetical protein
VSTGSDGLTPKEDAEDSAYVDEELELDRDIEPRPPPTLPRWIAIPAGLLLLPIVLVSIAGSVFLIADPPRANPIAAQLVGLVMLALLIWLAAKCVQLIFGRRSKHGGLFSPNALRACSVVALLLPAGGLITGYAAEHPLRYIAVATAYVGIAIGLWRLAAAREQKLSAPSVASAPSEVKSGERP